MKKKFAFSIVLVAGLLAACGGDSSSSAKDDCTLAEKGIKILQPEEGDEFKVGEELTIMYVANSPRANGFQALYKVDENDQGVDLFDTSFGEDAPDGTRCSVEKVTLDSTLVKASDKAILRLQAYGEKSQRADVNIVVKE